MKLEVIKIILRLIIISYVIIDLIFLDPFYKCIKLNRSETFGLGRSDALHVSNLEGQTIASFRGTTADFTNSITQGFMRIVLLRLHSK